MLCFVITWKLHKNLIKYEWHDKFMLKEKFRKSIQFSSVQFIFKSDHFFFEHAAHSSYHPISFIDDFKPVKNFDFSRLHTSESRLKFHAKRHPYLTYILLLLSNWNWTQMHRARIQHYYSIDVDDERKINNNNWFNLKGKTKNITNLKLGIACKRFT